MSLRVFEARYESKCARCSVVIDPGERIAMLPGSGAVHERCVPSTFAAETSGTEGKDARYGGGRGSRRRAKSRRASPGSRAVKRPAE